MSMPIQRQSESFGIFDDGPRFARDRASTDLPKGLAGLINTTGPRIQAGLLNTRQAGQTPPHDFVPGKDYSGGQDWELKDEDGYYGDFTPEDFCDVCGEAQGYDNHPLPGPHIQAGLLNTRQAGAITDPDPSDQEGVAEMNWPGWKRRNLDEDGQPYQDWPNPNRSPEQRRDDAYQEWISRGAPHHGSRTASCEYCGEPGHDWKIHPEAHRDIADWEREKHALEFPFGDYTEGVYPSEDDHGGEAWPGHQAARLAVNTDGMDPASHAYGRQPYDPLFGEFGHDGYDYEGVSRSEYRRRTRDYDPEEASQIAREDEDDESGYNWGPDPSNQLHPGDFRHSNSAEPFDSPTYHPRSAPYDNITGSRHPFDRAAARRLADKDGECTCWEGYERVPGTEPCASGSCRKKTSHRLAGSGIDWSRVRPGPLVDTPLFEQDPDDYTRVRPYSGPYCPDCNRPIRWVSSPGCDHTELVDQYYRHAAVKIQPWESTDEGWHNPGSGFRIVPSEQNPDQWQMLAPAAKLKSTDPERWATMAEHPDPQVLMDHHDWMHGGEKPSWHGRSRWWHQMFPPELPPHTARRTAAPVMDPTQMQAPQGGGYQIGHQVALAWRPGSNINGIVIGVNGPDVHVRWEDGQHSTEEFRNIHPR